MAFPRWFIDDVLARTSLVEVVGRRVAYDRRRSNPARRDFWACCPFHDEATPSFHVEEDKKLYHCFGCGKSGSAITFLEETEGLTREEAVKRLAEGAGLALPTPRQSAGARAEADARAALATVMERAATLYAGELWGPRGAAARSYLERRGLSRPLAEAFGLGLAPDAWSHLHDALTRGGTPPGVLEAAGLVRPRRSGSGFVDLFRNRLIVPIHDMRGKVIAFGGRALDPAEKAKYINSPETPLFHKGEVLFNLHRAGPHARRSGRLIVVEGYMDVIALARAGLPEAVAPLGTALTAAQGKRLFQIAREVVLMFDGDAAGRAAAARALATLLPDLGAQTRIRVARLPDGQDPDDVVRAHGPQAIAEVLAAAEPLVEALWTNALGAVDIADPQGRQTLEARLTEEVGTIREPGLRHQFLAEFRARVRALT
ncbi:MAG: DNA primase, partial [Alphaproteobacteria bacterium]|nr:DNA primase [Alphaproteobacteria bacterium]